ncbi:MAG TPA: type II toxin-antitoxin system VapC family toxin [Anaeromyxobacteraceae bacterium]|nr:type II toxin-antitoxin system VapC family toxin [Anaeromyxobacteraceae bacterium]
MTLVDTSVLVQVEKKKLQALELVGELLAAGRLAVSAVTAHELLRSPDLSDAWRDFWLDFLDAVEVVDLDLDAAVAAASLWRERRSRNRGVKLDVGDVLIAGTAAARAMDAVTDDDGFAELAGARLVRPS